jgi:hypothetical protein
MKTHSNGCKPRIAIALSGWNTSPSIRSLIAIAPTIVFKSSSGESTCPELDYEIPDAPLLSGNDAAAALLHGRLAGGTTPFIRRYSTI